MDLALEAIRTLYLNFEAFADYLRFYPRLAEITYDIEQGEPPGSLLSLILWNFEKDRPDDFLKAVYLIDNFKDLLDFGYPLHHCIVSRNICLLNLLLEKKVNPNKQEETDKRTPLHYAIVQGETEMVLLLLHHGADPKLEDSENRNALLYAANMEPPNKEIMSMLYRNGANVDDALIKNPIGRRYMTEIRENPDIDPEHSSSVSSSSSGSVSSSSSGSASSSSRGLASSSSRGLASRGNSFMSGNIDLVDDVDDAL